MITRNLRHLRLLLAVADTGSATQTARLCNVSQPAVTQALRKIEREAGTALMQRSPQGIYPTPAGEALVARVRQALGRLDGALEAMAPRLRRNATTPQLMALVAICEAGNMTLAARRLGIAQPTVHRALSMLDQEAQAGGAAGGLFERTSHGTQPRRATRVLARAVELAFAELDQADADLAEFAGREVGRITVGSMPLARSSILPQALARFRRVRPRLPVRILDGSYDDLLAGLRRGEIDFLIGALRDPAPIGDVEQRPLYQDRIALVAGLAHPLAAAKEPSLADLARFPWVVPRAGTPTRAQFDALFAPLGTEGPQGVIESGSIMLMRELLGLSDHLGCISRAQAEAEISRGLLVALPLPSAPAFRPIGLTLRQDFVPTAAQRLLMDCLADVEMPGAESTAPLPDSRVPPG